MRFWWALVLMACGVAACEPAADPDGGAIDGGALDVSQLDAGCSAIPGELLGERRVAAGALLPDLAFTTAEGEVALSDLHTPCEARVLVIRSMSSWSGPSQWHAAHTARILSESRVTLLDLLTEDEDALPADLATLARWQARYDVAPSQLAIDPTDRFAGLAIGGVRLPLVAIVNARDLRVVRVLFAPHAGDIEYEIQVALAAIDGERPPTLPATTLVDGRYTEEEWDLILGMRWQGPAPDPSNALGDDSVAAGIGATFFEDAGLSPEGIGCPTCHQESLGFADGLAVGHGVDDVLRNTPTLYGAAHARWPFWDGRVDSLWAQALGPIESPLEMNSSRLFVAHRVADVHQRSYETLFGPLPDLSDLARFPAAGAPGDPAYDAMSEADRQTIDLIFSNVGKAMAVYERSLVPPTTAFDRYLDGAFEALTPIERDGLFRFVENGCVQCHHGPTLSDGAFHNIGMPGSVPGDAGRIDAFAALSTSVFRRHGRFSDDALAVDPLVGLSSFPERTRGAFRTPPLRALSLTAPYGHGGTFPTLRAVVTHYAEVRGAGGGPGVEGQLDAHVPGFDSVEVQVGPLAAFLETL